MEAGCVDAPAAVLGDRRGDAGGADRSQKTLTPVVAKERSGRRRSGGGDEPQARIDGDDPVGPEPFSASSSSSPPC